MVFKKSCWSSEHPQKTSIILFQEAFRNFKNQGIHTSWLGLQVREPKVGSMAHLLYNDVLNSLYIRGVICSWEKHSSSLLLPIFKKVSATFLWKETDYLLLLSSQSSQQGPGDLPHAAELQLPPLSGTWKVHRKFTGAVKSTSPLTLWSPLKFSFPQEYFSWPLTNTHTNKLAYYSFPSGKAKVLYISSFD